MSALRGQSYAKTGWDVWPQRRHRGHPTARRMPAYVGAESRHRSRWIIYRGAFRQPHSGLRGCR